MHSEQPLKYRCHDAAAKKYVCLSKIHQVRQSHNLFTIDDSTSELVRRQYLAVDLTEAESLLAVLALAETPDDDVIAVLQELPLFARVISQRHRFAATPTKFQHRAK